MLYVVCWQNEQQNHEKICRIYKKKIVGCSINSMIMPLNYFTNKRIHGGSLARIIIIIIGFYNKKVQNREIAKQDDCCFFFYFLLTFFLYGMERCSFFVVVVCNHSWLRKKCLGSFSFKKYIKKTVHKCVYRSYC